MTPSRGAGALSFQPRDLTEDADDSLAVLQRHRAHLDDEALARRVEQHELCVGELRRSSQLLREDLARQACRLGRDDGGELAPDRVADKSLCGPVQPADDAVCVDHVGRDVDVLERCLDVSTEGVETGH